MSLRGHSKLLYDGYAYLKDSERNGVTLWRCDKQRQRRLQCRGRAQTRKVGQIEMVRACGIHNHPPNNVELETIELDK